ncbi:MAG: hypothetical protein RIQ56_146 [Candidatus Parcubacteria bacterium]|jgi:hypothetical protein
MKTVGDLINELSRLDPNLPVVVDDGDDRRAISGFDLGVWRLYAGNKLHWRHVTRSDRDSSKGRDRSWFGLNRIPGRRRWKREDTSLVILQLDV